MKKMIVMSLLLGASSWSMAAKPAELLKGHNMVHAPTATNASVQKVSQTVKNTANNAVQAAQNTASSVKNTATTNIKNAATTVKNNATQAVQNATTQATTATTETNNNNVVKNDAAVITQEALRKVEEMAKKTANLERQLEETQKRNAALQQQLAEISKTSVAPTIAVAQQIPPSVQQIQKDVDKKVNNATKKISDASKKATDAVKKSANDATQKIQQATTTTTSVDVTKLNTLTPSQKMDYLKQVQQTYRNLLQTQNQDISDINRLQQKLLSAQKKLEEAKLQVDKLNAELMLSQDIQADQYRKLQSAGAELNQAWKAVYGESSTPPRLSNNDTSKKI